MRQALALAVGAAVIVGITCEARSQNAPEKKIKVCHAVGNGQAHVIEISQNALNTHLSHGDSTNVPEGLKAGRPCKVDGSNGGAILK